jgi:flavin-binding protein dodecin
MELTGTSTTSLEEAIENAIARAAKTVRKMRWFEVVETRGRVDDGKVAEWQVTLKVGFALED